MSRCRVRVRVRARVRVRVKVKVRDICIVKNNWMCVKSEEK